MFYFLQELKGKNDAKILEHLLNEDNYPTKSEPSNDDLSKIEF
jgi:hypothetical protein